LDPDGKRSSLDLFKWLAVLHAIAAP
jgi:hypothetical protein